MANVTATNGPDLIAKLKALPTGGPHVVTVADGWHAKTVIDGIDKGALIEIVAANPGKALFDRLHIKRSKNITVRGMHAAPKVPVKVLGSTFDYAFRAMAGCSKVVFDDCHVLGAPDANAYDKWTLADWLAKGGLCGFMIEGPDCHVRRSSVLGGRMGYNLAPPAKGATLTDSRGEGLCGDGIKVTGDGQKAQRNRITDLKKVDGNHPDLLQAYGRKVNGVHVPLADIVVEDNVLLEWTRTPNDPLNATGIQGIGMFNPPYVRPVIRRNKIANSHPHGITLAGAQALTLEDNIVWNVDHGLAGVNTKVPLINIRGTFASFKGNRAPAYANAAAAYSPANALTDYANLPVV